MAEFDNLSKLQSYEDYIANNITEWEAESIASVCRNIGKIEFHDLVGNSNFFELCKFDDTFEQGSDTYYHSLGDFLLLERLLVSLIISSTFLKISSTFF